MGIPGFRIAKETAQGAWVADSATPPLSKNEIYALPSRTQLILHTHANREDELGKKAEKALRRNKSIKLGRDRSCGVLQRMLVQPTDHGGTIAVDYHVALAGDPYEVRKIHRDPESFVGRKKAPLRTKFDWLLKDALRHEPRIAPTLHKRAIVPTLLAFKKRR